MRTRIGGLIALLFVVSSTALAQDNATPDKKDDGAKVEGPVTALVGADIHTVTNGVIRGGTILIRDGRILNVGQSIEIPEGAQTIDVTGKVVSPGFVGINVSGIAIRSAPQNNDKLEDALDPFDRNMKYALGVGITTSCIEYGSGGRGRRRRDGEPQERFPGLEPMADQFVTEAQLDYGDEDTSLCPCCGLPILPTEPITATPPTTAKPRKHAVLKMSFGDLGSMLVKEHSFYSPTPGALTGALNRHNWRRDVKRARDAVERLSQKKAEEQKEGDASSGTSSNRGSRGASRGSRRGSGNEELMRLVRKESRLRIRANTIDEIRDMIALARELDYKLTIEGGIEAWLIASELGEAEVSVIFTPRQRRRPAHGREESSGSSIESTGIFQEKGVPFATAALGSSVSMGGIAGRDLTSLPLEAAFAVRGGASNETALESLTIVPARMLGLEDRIGSIEKDKDADLLILNGHPLDYRTYVETAIVNGKICYERNKDRVFPTEDSQTR